MKIHIQVVIDYEDGQATPLVEEVACLPRGDLLPETLGLTLAEGKQLLAKVQQSVVQQQVETYVAQPQYCPHCEKKHTLKDDKPLTIRTVFGKFQLKSPRFYTCPCQPQK